LTRRWVRGSSYFVLYGTALEFRFQGQGPPLEDLVRIYKYTGKSFEHDQRYEHFEYVYTDKQTGENLTVYRQRRIGRLDKPPKTTIEVPNDSKHIHYYVAHYDAKKYKEQMKKFKVGEIKSRPNGRVWCYLKGNWESYLRR
jgi:hypothetical protein